MKTNQILNGGSGEEDKPTRHEREIKEGSTVGTYIFTFHELLARIVGHILIVQALPSIT